MGRIKREKKGDGAKRVVTLWAGIFFYSLFWLSGCSSSGSGSVSEPVATLFLKVVDRKMGFKAYIESIEHPLHGSIEISDKERRQSEKEIAAGSYQITLACELYDQGNWVALNSMTGTYRLKGGDYFKVELMPDHHLANKQVCPAFLIQVAPSRFK